MKVGRKLLIAKRILLYGALLVCCFLGLAAYVALGYHPAPAEVVCSGNPGDMGKQYGPTLRFPLKLMTRIYLDRVLCGGQTSIIQSRRRRAEAALDSFPEVYQKELAAIAAASGCEGSALAYGNCFLDLGHAVAGCRSVVIPTDTGWLRGHNLDWDNLGGSARWTTCIVRRNPNDGRLRTVSIGFPGLIGSLDIINEKGLALSFIQGLCDREDSIDLRCDSGCLIG